MILKKDFLLIIAVIIWYKNTIKSKWWYCEILLQFTKNCCNWSCDCIFFPIVLYLEKQTRKTSQTRRKLTGLLFAIAVISCESVKYIIRVEKRCWYTVQGRGKFFWL